MNSEVAIAVLGQKMCLYFEARRACLEVKYVSKVRLAKKVVAVLCSEAQEISADVTQLSSLKCLLLPLLLMLMLRARVVVLLAVCALSRWVGVL